MSSYQLSGRLQWQVGVASFLRLATCDLHTCHLPPLKQKLFTFAKIAISLGLIAYVFSKVHVEAVLASLASANPWLILLALVFYVLAIVISGVKWNVLLRALDVHVPFSAVLQYMFVGFFFNNVFPANIGGDVMRGYGMARATDRTADAAVSVVVDRLDGPLGLHEHRSRHGDRRHHGHGTYQPALVV